MELTRGDLLFLRAICRSEAEESLLLAQNFDGTSKTVPARLQMHAEQCREIEARITDELTFMAERGE